MQYAQLKVLKIKAGELIVKDANLQGENIFIIPFRKQLISLTALPGAITKPTIMFIFCKNNKTGKKKGA